MLPADIEQGIVAPIGRHAAPACADSAAANGPVAALIGCHVYAEAAQLSEIVDHELQVPTGPVHW